MDREMYYPDNYGTRTRKDRVLYNYRCDLDSTGINIIVITKNLGAFGIPRLLLLSLFFIFFN